MDCISACLLLITVGHERYSKSAKFYKILSEKLVCDLYLKVCVSVVCMGIASSGWV